MHGVVHKTLEEYVVDRSDDEVWATITDRAAVEPTLYLAVSYYDDRDVDAILETLSGMAVQSRRQIERGFGRRLAPELLSTFGAHVPGDWSLLELLAGVEGVVDEVESAAASDASLPDVSGRRDGREVLVTYRSERDYCGVAHGVLEGLVDAYDAPATVSKRSCVREGDDACAFLVALEESAD